jgi:predicted anti-sigma-YlaC factor YlaD
MGSEILTCKQLVELVTEYFEGALTPQERDRFEEHVMSCPPCRVYLGQMRQTIKLMGDIPEETVSPDAEAALVAAFRGWQRE